MPLLVRRGKDFGCVESFCNPSGRWIQPLDLIFGVTLSRSSVSNHVAPAAFTCGKSGSANNSNRMTECRRVK